MIEEMLLMGQLLSKLNLGTRGRIFWCEPSLTHSGYHSFSLARLRVGLYLEAVTLKDWCQVAWADYVV